MRLAVFLLTLALTYAEDPIIKGGDVAVPEPLTSGPQPPPSGLSENDDDYDAPPVDPLPPDVHAPAFPKLSPTEDQNDFTTTEDPAEADEDFDLPTKKPESVPNIAEINRTEIEQEGMIISSTDDYLDVSENGNGSFTGENSTKTEVSSGTIIIGERIPNNPVKVDKFSAIPNAVVVGTPEQIVIDKISIDETKTVDDESEALSASERKESLEDLPVFGNPKGTNDEQPFTVRAQAKDSLGEDHFVGEGLSKPISKKKKDKNSEKSTEKIAATVADIESSNAKKEKVFGETSESHKDNKDLTAEENTAIDDFFNGIDTGG
ncbi:unnamed protein product [Cylicostephanus goldi]|uniref:Uncharacterized protein n=1 Tax=Cylicostephanus goldi TaxID=71465 RepID=A0A3P6QP20_CYLGO|nr:unnamed protein product [Cylicostephanus goldi]